MLCIATTSELMNRVPASLIKCIIAWQSCKRVQAFFEEEVSKARHDSVTRVLNRGEGASWLTLIGYCAYEALLWHENGV